MACSVPQATCRWKLVNFIKDYRYMSYKSDKRILYVCIWLFNMSIKWEGWHINNIPQFVAKIKCFITKNNDLLKPKYHDLKPKYYDL